MGYIENDAYKTWSKQKMENIENGVYNKLGLRKCNIQKMEY